MSSVLRVLQGVRPGPAVSSQDRLAPPWSRIPAGIPGGGGGFHVTPYIPCSRPASAEPPEPWLRRDVSRGKSQMKHCWTKVHTFSVPATCA